MPRGQPLKSRQERRVPKTNTPTTTAYLSRRDAAIKASGNGFSERMKTYHETPPPQASSRLSTTVPTCNPQHNTHEVCLEADEVFVYPMDQGDKPNYDEGDEDPLVSRLKSAAYQRERFLHEERWDSQYGLMLDAYLRLRTVTHDWSSPFTWNKDFTQECLCPVSQRRLRKVDLVDIICKYCTYLN